jgi:predicted DNA-binding protein
MEERTPITFYGPANLKARLEEQAQKEGRPVSNLLRQIAEKYLAQQNGKAQEPDCGKAA